MNVKQLFTEFLKGEKHRISLTLGECRLNSDPLSMSETSLVYKARLNGHDVALKFFLYEGERSEKGRWLNLLKTKYLKTSLLETRNNIVRYADLDIVSVRGEVIPPQICNNGYIKFDNSNQYRLLDIWIHSDNDPRNDYILVHHSNTLPEKVNGKDVYRWAVYEDHALITWEEAMNGFAESDGDIIALDRTKIEFYNRIPREGYVFIALNHLHSLSSPANVCTLKDYFFRFSFNYVNRYILDDMNNMTKLHVTSPKRK